MKKMLLTAVMILSTITIYAEDEPVKEPVDEQAVEEKAAEEAVTGEKADEEKVVKEKVENEKVPEEKQAKKEPPEKNTEAGTINVAVLSLDNRGSFSNDEIKLFTDRINSEVLRVKQFTVVERQQIGEILEEQGFQQSGACTDQECMLEIGQLLAVKKIVGGSIGKVEDMYPVTLKLIDIQTGKIEAQVVKDFSGNKKKLLSEFIPQITKLLMNEAGYLEKVASKKKGLLAKPGFWIPAIAVIGGGAAAAVLLTKDDGTGGEGTGVEEMDLSDFPGHIITIPGQ